MSGPDATTIWTFVYGLVLVSITGIAFWSYNHRDSYWKLMVTIGLVGAIISSVMIVSNFAIWIIARDIGDKLSRNDAEIVSAVLRSHQWPTAYIATVGVFGWAVVILNLTPHKKTDKKG
ncbi:hypothetical protein PQ455_01605 [Sphingomonas naphthae]|uniref:Uncharacterized protein n=1 Tax=Sphingomonas naphthae TaxID=1813468 RepID=A0ABY7TLV5_9SPHN|nr:hypothetical protein [Sphingomonas naphthae]WCT73956.1 hypothetical protein PQ455_01605 [Sphingomonas naphthae]